MPAKAGIQYSTGGEIQPRGRGVLDRPPSRTMTVENDATPRGEVKTKKAGIAPGLSSLC